MREWYTVQEAADKLLIPHQTLRRYIASHKHLLRMMKEGRYYKIHDESLEVLRKMRELYDSGKTTADVDRAILEEGMPVTVTIEEEDGPKRVEANEIFVDIQKALAEQKEFNKDLVELLEQQALNHEQKFNQMLKHQQFLEQKLQEKDEQLMLTMEEKKQENDEPEVDNIEVKSWWKRFFG